MNTLTIKQDIATLVFSALIMIEKAIHFINTLLHHAEHDYFESFWTLFYQLSQ